jgi:AraC-like DNA-binding protein
VTNTFIAHRTARRGVVRVEATLADFAFPAHSHEHVCIGIVRSGAHDCRYGLRRHTVVQGDLMLVNPGEVHDGRPSGRCGRRYTMLEIDLGAFRSICRDALCTEWIEFRRAVVGDPGAGAALSAWLDALDGTNSLAERDASALVLGRLVDHADRGPRAVAGNDLAARVLRRMREDDTGADGIGALAAETGVSRYALIRAFKRSFGLSPEEMRRQLRIERARVLLAGSAALVDIAAAAGFADQSHMTRELRRLLGISPAAYRRALQSP